jgi:enoyl-CoA hydratase
MNEALSVETNAYVTTISIRRPERRNALHGPLWDGLRDMAERLSMSPPRAVIITGADGHFSSGMDLKPDNPLVMDLLPALQTKDADAFRALIVRLKAVVDAIAAIPCPVIAAIEGACTGGGLELALACDMRVAAHASFFALPEARIGMMPDVGGTVRLSRLVGRARAMELILTNERIDAATAHTWGLVNRLAPYGASLDAAHALARQLTSSSPAAMREVVRLLRAPSPTFEDETEAGVRVLLSGDAAEGVSAFLERRNPAWSL